MRINTLNVALLAALLAAYKRIQSPQSDNKIAHRKIWR